MSAKAKTKVKNKHGRKGPKKHAKKAEQPKKLRQTPVEESTRTSLYVEREAALHEVRRLRDVLSQIALATAESRWREAKEARRLALEALGDEGE